MTDPLAMLSPWLYTANVWLLTAVAVAGLIAFVRQSPLARRFLPRRDAPSAPGRFERFWSRRDGRAIALGWVALFALTVGDGGLVRSVVLPAFLVLFMLPSLAYAWMLPHREDETPDGERPTGRLVGAEA